LSASLKIVTTLYLINPASGNIEQKAVNCFAPKGYQFEIHLEEPVNCESSWQAGRQASERPFAVRQSASHCTWLKRNCGLSRGRRSWGYLEDSQPGH